MHKIFFITGVNGAGKSTIIPYLKLVLPEDSFVVYDFDARGVPPDADRKWRISETKYWISEGEKISEEKSTVICGFIKPSDLAEYNLINNESPEIVLVLLDAKPEIIKKRLINRYTKDGVFDKSQKVIGRPIDEFIKGNVLFAEQIKNEFKKSGFPIIDTSNLIPEEVANEVIKIISIKENK